MASAREIHSRSSSESSFGVSPEKLGKEEVAVFLHEHTPPFDDSADRPAAQVPFQELLDQISKSKEQLCREPEKPWVPPQPRWDPGETKFVVASSVLRAFDAQAGFLHPRQFGLWDQERIIAPERTWPAVGKGAAELYDRGREGLPDWKPGGFAPHWEEAFPFKPARERQAASRRGASVRGRDASAQRAAESGRCQRATPRHAWTGPPRSPKTPQPLQSASPQPGGQTLSGAASPIPGGRAASPAGLLPGRCASSCSGQRLPTPQPGQRALSSAPPSARNRTTPTPTPTSAISAASAGKRQAARPRSAGGRRAGGIPGRSSLVVLDGVKTRA